MYDNNDTTNMTIIGIIILLFHLLFVTLNNNISNIVYAYHHQQYRHHRQQQQQQHYPIGRPGIPWNTKEKEQWFYTRTYHRSYDNDVIQNLLNSVSDNKDILTMEQYDTLYMDDNIQYPLYVIKNKHWDNDKPSILITGGVHGYETSGVHGILLFLRTQRKLLKEYYTKYFNICIVPCVNPWGYETLERWNSYAQDPNRNFQYLDGNNDEKDDDDDNHCFESIALQNYINTAFSSSSKEENNNNNNWICHLDLHETTNLDRTEYQPAKLARDGIILPNTGGSGGGSIPDGFYFVGNSDQQKQYFPRNWHQTMLHAVSKVTHIAPIYPSSSQQQQQRQQAPSSSSLYINPNTGIVTGDDVWAEGVIVTSAKKNGMCMGLTDAKYVTTTEIYPDSITSKGQRLLTSQQCNYAQLTCIVSSLNYIIQNDILLGEEESRRQQQQQQLYYGYEQYDNLYI